MISVLTMSNLLYNSDNSDDLIIECIDAKIDGKEFPLNEAIELFPKLSEFSILIEAVDDISDIKKNVNDIKKEKDPEKINSMLDKLIISVKKVFNWWYKVEPDKKYKTLHTILKLLLIIIGIILVIYGPGKLSIVKNVAARLPIGYEGANKILKLLFSKTRIAYILVGTIYGKIFKFLDNTNLKIEEKVNKKDIEKSIEEIDKSIDEINEKLKDIDDPDLEKQLKEIKKDLEKCLAKLIAIKERIDNKDKKK